MVVCDDYELITLWTCPSVLHMLPTVLNRPVTAVEGCTDGLQHWLVRVSEGFAVTMYLWLRFPAEVSVLSYSRFLEFLAIRPSSQFRFRRQMPSLLLRLGFKLSFCLKLTVGVESGDPKPLPMPLHV